MRDDEGQRRRTVRRLAGYGARLGLVLGILGGVGAGVAALNARAGVGSAAVPPPPPPVLTLGIEESPGHAEARRFAGRLEPARETALGFERAGLVSEILVAEGEPVAAGEVVARLDTALIANEQVRLAAARDGQETRVELARLTYERQQGLTDRATSGQRRDETRLAVAEARAALAETEAALAGLAIDLAKSELRAPFAGRVAARHADEGAVLDAGAPVLALLETDRPRARIGLAPETAASLVVGETYALQHDGTAHPARLAALRPDLDPGTRTATAIFELEGAPDLPFGAVMTFESEAWIPGPGFWIPVSALVEGGRGYWTVYTLTPDATLGREAVTVVGLRGGEAFVQGSLRDGDRIVRDGTHRVRPGQDVLVARAE